MCYVCWKKKSFILFAVATFFGEKKIEKNCQVFPTLNSGGEVGGGQSKHWSKGSNCIETTGVLKAVA